MDPEDLTPDEAPDAVQDAIAGERASWVDPHQDGAHESFGLVEPTPEAVERLWREYWVPLLKGEGPKISLARLKGELWDAYHLVTNARPVYHHVTGGLTDDLAASADGIIALADKHVATLTEGLRAEVERALRDALQERARAEKLEAVVVAARSFWCALEAVRGGYDPDLQAFHDAAEGSIRRALWLHGREKAAAHALRGALEAAASYLPEEEDDA